MNLKDSIYEPRLHLEEDCLYLEPGVIINQEFSNNLKTIRDIQSNSIFDISSIGGKRKK